MHNASIYCTTACLFIGVSDVLKFPNPLSNLSFIIYVPALRPNTGHCLHIHDLSRSHTTTHHSGHYSSGRLTKPLQRHLPDKTQHSKQTHSHSLRWDSNTHTQQECVRRPTTRDHWDRLIAIYWLFHGLIILVNRINIYHLTTVPISPRGRISYKSIWCSPHFRFSDSITIVLTLRTYK